jgi:hypothetical protein
VATCAIERCQSARAWVGVCPAANAAPLNVPTSTTAEHSANVRLARGVIR